MNIPPNTTPKMLKRDVAAAWLRRHDPNIKRDSFRARKKRERDEKLARNNTALVARYRRTMLKI